MDKLAKKKSGRLRAEIFKTVVSVLVLGLSIALFAKLFSMRDVPPDKVSTALIPLVSVVPAKHYTGKIDLVVSGLVQPAHEINVTSEVSGVVKVKHRACESGTYVFADTPLLEIDPAGYNATLETNKADMQQATKRMEEAKVEIVGAGRSIELAIRELAIAESDHQRNLRLLSQGVISKSEADLTERAYVAAKSQLTARENAKTAAEARLESAKATEAVSQTRIDQSQLDIDKLKIKASKTGVVVREYVQEGDAVRIGTPLLTFEATDKVEVLATLTPTELAWIRKNKKIDTSGMTPEECIAAAYAVPQVDVKVYERGAPGVVWDGVLERFDGVGRDDTKTIPCRIVIDKPVVHADQSSNSPPKALFRNTYVKCRIEVEIEESDPAKFPLILPAAAVTPGDYVWIANNKQLDRKKVTVLDHIIDEESREPMVVISMADDSVQFDDWVVVSPLNQPTIGAEARIVEEPAPSEPPMKKAEPKPEMESLPGPGPDIELQDTSAGSMLDEVE